MSSGIRLNCLLYWMPIKFPTWARSMGTTFAGIQVRQVWNSLKAGLINEAKLFQTGTPLLGASLLMENLTTVTFQNVRKRRRQSQHRLTLKPMCLITSASAAAISFSVGLGSVCCPPMSATVTKTVEMGEMKRIATGGSLTNTANKGADDSMCLISKGG